MTEPPRRVVVAVDSFKGTIGAARAARALAAGWLRARPHDDVVLRPMADGGEGTLDAFEAAVPGAQRMPVTVTGPDDAQVRSYWLLLPPTQADPNGTAVVELAATSGIELLQGRLLPLDAHTAGFGEAIADALAAKPSRLLLAIGSSASTDGGAGMLTALGARFTDADGHPVPRGGRGLSSIVRADLAGLPVLPPGGAVVLSDVTSPLLGPGGAAAVFAPQKGAAAGEVEMLERGLRNLSALLPGDPESAGAGAAGGTGFALLTWGATLTAGAPQVATTIGLDAAIAGADLVITGEGSFDRQSAHGKAPGHVLGRAGALGVPVAVVAGRIADDADLTAAVAAASLTELAGSSTAAMADAEHWLQQAALRLAESVF